LAGKLALAITDGVRQIWISVVFFRPFGHGLRKTHSDRPWFLNRNIMDVIFNLGLGIKELYDAKRRASDAQAE